MIRSTKYDVVVLGGGAGGLCAAARFAAAGYRILLVEATDRLGGRWSTLEIDGHRVTTGAVAIEVGGVLEETFRLVGADFDLRLPDPPVVIRIKGRNMRPSGAMWDWLIKNVTKGVADLIVQMRTPGIGEPEKSLTLDAWVGGVTKSQTVHSLFQALAKSLFTVNADEVPAAAFFRLLSSTGGYKRFGFAPRGNIVLAEALAGAIRRLGGDIVTGAEAQSIVVSNRRAAGARVVRGGTVVEVESERVISDLGPCKTAELLRATPFEAPFNQRVSEVVPSSIIALTLASEEQLIPVPGVWTIGDTDRLYGCANFTQLCPELAPPGIHMFEAWSIPKPASSVDFDAEMEIDLVYRDLEKIIPRVRSRTRLVFTKVMRANWPGDRCRPGHEPSPITSLAGLYDVGDGVKPLGWSGTSGCAETARIVFEHADSTLGRPAGTSTQVVKR